MQALLTYSAAVIVALIKHVPSGPGSELAKLTNAFIAIRIAYSAVYVVAANVPLSAVRSSVWTMGFAITLKIFALAFAQ
jgi:uncharacterized MAPEG superfamily protein